jgi:arylsulfatase A
MRFSLLLLFLCVSVGASERPPNLVLIFCDDLGYGDIGPFGAQDYETPHLDQLAAQGSKLTSFHVSQPVCSASRASLLTGCYANRVGIHGALNPKAKHGLAASEVTLAEIAKSKGYATCAVGKWHLGHHAQFLPTRHGFDSWMGIPYSNDMWPYHPEAKAGTYPDLPLFENETIIDADLTPEDQRQLTTRFTERAVEFINGSKDQPFFLYVAHPMPHVPLYVSEKFAGKTKRGLFGDVVAEIDWSTGQIMQALEKNGVAKDTWVIFTSDNGPWLSYGRHAGSAGPLREGKGTCWEGGVRVPCLMSFPGRIPAGTTNDAMAMTIDILPTFAALIGADLPAHPIDGKNLWPVFTQQKDATNPHAWYAHWYQQNELQTVTSGDGRWKLILPHRYRTMGDQTPVTGPKPGKYLNREITEEELYDLKADVGETTNVAAANPEVMKTMLAFAEEARKKLGDRLTNTPASEAREPDSIK